MQMWHFATINKPASTFFAEQKICHSVLFVDEHINDRGQTKNAHADLKSRAREERRNVGAIDNCRTFVDTSIILSYCGK
jgi:hypothetical protein